MFSKIKYWLIESWLSYKNIENASYQYRACTYCGKKYWFDIIKCGCGNPLCTNEEVCVCNNCINREKNE